MEGKLFKKKLVPTTLCHLKTSQELRMRMLSKIICFCSDPRPAAEQLKELGVEFYTFGIRNGNVKELFDMASEPRAEHSFIVDSFEEFEALARRALHKDLGGGVYLPVDPSSCSRLCNAGQDCCDLEASCACGAHSGTWLVH